MENTKIQIRIIIILMIILLIIGIIVIMIIKNNKEKFLSIDTLPKQGNLSYQNSSGTETQITQIGELPMNPTNLKYKAREKTIATSDSFTYKNIMDNYSSNTGIISINIIPTDIFSNSFTLFQSTGTATTLGPSNNYIDVFPIEPNYIPSTNIRISSIVANNISVSSSSTANSYCEIRNRITNTLLGTSNTVSNPSGATTYTFSTPVSVSANTQITLRFYVTPSTTAFNYQGGTASQSFSGRIIGTQTIIPFAENGPYFDSKLRMTITDNTYTLPTGDWIGEVLLVYGNQSGRVAMRKYAFGKINTIGYFLELYHDFVAVTDSSVSFNITTGIFTCTLNNWSSYTGVTGNFYIKFYSAPSNLIPSDTYNSSTVDPYFRNITSASSFSYTEPEKSPIIKEIVSFYDPPVTTGGTGVLGVEHRFKYLSTGSELFSTNTSIKNNTNIIRNIYLEYYNSSPNTTSNYTNTNTNPNFDTRYSITSSSTTYTIPSTTRVAGEYIVSYFNSVTNVKGTVYGRFYKAPGATSNGFLTRNSYYSDNNTSRTIIAFNQSTGIFTFTPDTNSSLNFYITYYTNVI